MEEKAILYDDNGRVVMEFFPTFKVAKDTTIKGVTFNGCDFALTYRKSATYVLAHPEERTILDVGHLSNKIVKVSRKLTRIFIDR